jgi:hypothetical protein
VQLREPERVRSVTEVAGAFDLGAFDQMAFDTDRLVIVLEGGNPPISARKMDVVWLADSG